MDMTGKLYENVESLEQLVIGHGGNKRFAKE